MAGGSHDPAAASAPADTGGLTVMVGGKFDFQSVWQDQKENGTVANNAGGAGATDLSNSFFRNDTKLNFTAAGSTENFDYGAVIELNADTSANKDGNQTGALGGIADKTYLFVENDNFGRFEAGSNSGASDTLEVDASRIARATGGVDGDWRYNVTGVSAANGASSYLYAPNLPESQVDKTNPDRNKITYYTPRLGGVQLGVSYTPDTGNSGTAAAITADTAAAPIVPATTTTQYQNVFAGGLNYEADFEGVGIMASAIGEAGSAKDATGVLSATNYQVNDLAAYSLGLGVEFAGFSVAGSYGNLGDSGVAKTATVDKDSSFWDIGTAYENGPYGVSVTYFDSTKGTGTAAQTGESTGKNDLTNLVVGADYQMAPGLTPYVEASFFDLKNGGSTLATNYDNSGNVVMVGAELAF